MTHIFNKTHSIGTGRKIWAFIAVCTVVTILGACPLALSQMYGPDGPPFPAPPPMQMPKIGFFYVHSGVKFRVFNKLRFERLPNHGTTIRVAEGAPEFGPNSDGDVLFPAGGADWTYGNGLVQASGGGTAWTATDAITGGFTSSKGVGGLGHYGDSDSDLGRFQLNSNHPLATSTSVIADGTISFSAAFNQADGSQPWIAEQSRIVGYGVETVEPVVYDPQYWTPYVEIGYTYAPYFDLTFSVAWFNVSETDQDNRTAVAQWYERRFTDTYQFRTTQDTTTWVETFTGGSGESDSDNTMPTVAGDAFDYLIYPIGFINTPNSPQLPTRSFSQNIVGSNLPGSEMLTTKLDVDIIEMKLGIRNWYPLWGLARTGFTLGGIFAPMPYKITTSVNLIVDDSLQANAVPDPDTGNPIPNIPGTYTVIERADDVWWNFGGYVGADLQLYAGPLFVLTGAEYNWYSEKTYEDFSTKTVINPSGYTLTFAGGFRF